MNLYFFSTPKPNCTVDDPWHFFNNTEDPTNGINDIDFSARDVEEAIKALSLTASPGLISSPLRS